ncbi:MAG: hypothetical protein HQL56_18930, partial [Magnetococcales bacterium]|nr:hypothetical protein [Magnetococcales bacterium]
RLAPCQEPKSGKCQHALVGNKPSSPKTAIPKWDFGAANDADDSWNAPEIQLGLNRLALQDIARQHPDWDLSILEPMARGGALAGVGSMLKGMAGQTPANGFPNTMMAAAETPDGQNEPGSGAGSQEESTSKKLAVMGIRSLLPWPAKLIMGLFQYGLEKADGYAKEFREGAARNTGHNSFENCKTEECLRHGTEKSTDHIDARDKRKLEEQPKEQSQ